MVVVRLRPIELDRFKMGLVVSMEPFDIGEALIFLNTGLQTIL